MILAIDTACAYPVVAAVAADAGLLFARSGSRTRAHAEDLAPLLRAALRLGDPSTVAGGRGPGAFTGLRVGLVSARTLGWALQVPVVGTSSLDVVAEQTGLVDGWALLDARRGEVYLAQYSGGVRSASPLVLPRREAAGLIGADEVAGDAALLADEDRRARGTTVLDPEALAAVALKAAAADPPPPAEPEYLRRPDVTMSASNRAG